MSTRPNKDDPKYLKAYDRGMLRSAFVSLFWAVIMERRKSNSFTMLSLAKKLGANKGEVSRWFSTQPNWTINTISNIANALDLDVQIRAVDRNTGIIYTASGIEQPSQQSFATLTNPSITDPLGIYPIGILINDPLTVADEQIYYNIIYPIGVERLPEAYLKNSVVSAAIAA